MKLGDGGKRIGLKDWKLINVHGFGELILFGGRLSGVDKSKDLGRKELPGETLRN